MNMEKLKKHIDLNDKNSFFAILEQIKNKNYENYKNTIQRLVLYSAKNNKFDFVEDIIKIVNINLNTKDECGNNILYYSIKHNNEKLFYKLYGKIDIPKNKLLDMLELAIINNNLNIFQLLIVEIYKYVLEIEDNFNYLLTVAAREGNEKFYFTIKEMITKSNIKINYDIFLIQAIALGKNKNIIKDIKKEIGENMLLNSWIKRIEGATA